MNLGSRTFTRKRVLIALSLIFAFLGALGLAGASTESSTLFAAAHDIQSGQHITQSDLIKVKASVGESEKRYISTTKKFVPGTALRAIFKGELLPHSAVGATGTTTPKREIPLGIALSDIPFDLTTGEIVDVYMVPRDTHSQSEKIASSILVAAVDSHSRNLGGVINVVLSMKEADVIYVTDALVIGKLVLVRHGH